MVISLLGQNFRLHNGKLNLKSPSAGDLVDWHQDWAFYPHTNDDVLEKLEELESEIEKLKELEKDELEKLSDLDSEIQDIKDKFQ